MLGNFSFHETNYIVNYDVYKSVAKIYMFEWNHDLVNKSLKLIFVNFYTNNIGIWVPRRHNILWDVRWTWTMGTCDSQKSKKVIPICSALPMATNSCILIIVAGMFPSV